MVYRVEFPRASVHSCRTSAPLTGRIDHIHRETRAAGLMVTGSLGLCFVAVTRQS